MVTLYYYFDNSRQLVDFAVDPPDGACGSNWHPYGDYETAEEARKVGEQLLSEAPAEFGRGSYTNPTY